MLSVDEGKSINISCTSVGIPTPTIVWELNNEPTQYTPTEAIMEPQIPTSGFLQDIMLGRINSTIEVVNAQYPRDEGDYTCVGTNDEDMINYSNFSIFLQVLGM